MEQIVILVTINVRTNSYGMNIYIYIYDLGGYNPQLLGQAFICGCHAHSKRDQKVALNYRSLTIN